MPSGVSQGSPSPLSSSCKGEGCASAIVEKSGMRLMLYNRREDRCSLRLYPASPRGAIAPRHDGRQAGAPLEPGLALGDERLEPLAALVAPIATGAAIGRVGEGQVGIGKDRHQEEGDPDHDERGDRPGEREAEERRKQQLAAERRARNASHRGGAAKKAERPARKPRPGGAEAVAGRERLKMAELAPDARRCEMGQGSHARKGREGGSARTLPEATGRERAASHRTSGGDERGR